jgi:hypothetical protein
MTYACPAWEFAADTHLLRLQRLQSKVLNDFFVEVYFTFLANQRFYKPLHLHLYFICDYQAASIITLLGEPEL